MDRIYRTEVGDRVLDCVGGEARIVLQIWRVEDIGQFVTGTYHGSSTERCALYGTGVAWERRDRKRQLAKAER